MGEPIVSFFVIFCTKVYVNFLVLIREGLYAEVTISYFLTAVPLFPSTVDGRRFIIWYK